MKVAGINVLVLLLMLVEALASNTAPLQNGFATDPARQGDDYLGDDFAAAASADSVTAGAPAVSSEARSDDYLGDDFAAAASADSVTAEAPAVSSEARSDDYLGDDFAAAAASADSVRAGAPAVSSEARSDDYLGDDFAAAAAAAAAKSAQSSQGENEASVAERTQGDDYAGDDFVTSAPTMTPVAPVRIDADAAADSDTNSNSGSGSASAPPLPQGAVYGVDVTYPVHHQHHQSFIMPQQLERRPPGSGRRTQQGTDDDANNDSGDLELSHHADRYRASMKRCEEAYPALAVVGSGVSHSPCVMSEHYRTHRNLNVPRSRPHNFTAASNGGYLKVKCPGDVYEMITDFFYGNRATKMTREWFSDGKTLTNHWDSPSYVVNWERDDVLYGGEDFREAVQEGVGAVMQRFANGDLATSPDGTAHGKEGDWVPQPSTLQTDMVQVNPSALYGVRVFRDGAVVAPHVDQLPLMFTALIAVDQDLLEPWPIELFPLSRGGDANDGDVAINITLQPGEMLLYEGHSMIHGSPFPLVGKYSAYFYVHFMAEMSFAALAKQEHGEMAKHASVADAGVREFIQHGEAGIAALITEEIELAEAIAMGYENNAGKSSQRRERRHMEQRRKEAHGDTDGDEVPPEPAMRGVHVDSNGEEYVDMAAIGAMARYSDFVYNYEKQALTVREADIREEELRVWEAAVEMRRKAKSERWSAHHQHEL